MNTISASEVRRPRIPSARQIARDLGDLIAPRDHTVKGNWSKDADIPLWAWPASLALASIFLFGQPILAWALRQVL